jgi:hypothetical protein
MNLQVGTPEMFAGGVRRSAHGAERRAGEFRWSPEPDLAIRGQVPDAGKWSATAIAG